MPRRYSMEDSHLIIESPKQTPNDLRITWAVFDTSRTVEWRWIAISGNRYDAMLTFSNIDDLLIWCVDRVKCGGDVVRCGEDCKELGGVEWLDKTTKDIGCEGWEQYAAEWVKVTSPA